MTFTPGSLTAFNSVSTTYPAFDFGQDNKFLCLHFAHPQSEDKNITSLGVLLAGLSELICVKLSVGAWQVEGTP